MFIRQLRKGRGEDSVRTKVTIVRSVTGDCGELWKQIAHCRRGWGVQWAAVQSVNHDNFAHLE